jgi:PKD domain
VIRRLVFILTVVAVPFGGAASAGAVVIDPAVKSSTPVEYKAAEAGNYVGVALVPETRNALQTAEIPEVKTAGKCLDPVPSDLIRPKMRETGLCWHEGPVMHGNETFVVVWDPLRRYFATTKEYVEQFLRNVADASGALTSPYAVTPQYTDSSGHAGNLSLYGGACDDFGVHGGSACSFSSSSEPLRPGHEYTEECTATGTNDFYAPNPRPEPQPEFQEAPNDVCLTDTQIRREITAMVEQTGIIGHAQPGYTPLIVLVTPTGVETCLDAKEKLCSANGSPTQPPKPTVTTNATGGTVASGRYEVEVTYVTASGETAASAQQTVTTSGSTSTITVQSPPAGSGATGWYAYVTEPDGKVFARQQVSPTPIGVSFTLAAAPTIGPEPKPAAIPQFCSYHSQATVGSTKVDYVVQPWTAMTACDEPEVPEPELHKAWEPKAMETQLGEELVSPLSQSHIGTIVNPEMDGWFALDGSEIDDDGCIPLSEGLDSATVNGQGYLLRREFNNGWLLNTDPYVYRCAPGVVLEPKFVVPSPIDQGKAVAFDGSVTPSTLVVPAAGYTWEFGDGTKGTGPSVEHTFAQGGTYSVKLTVTDRGGYVRSTTQTINVLGPDGEVIAPPAPPAPTPTPASSGSTAITAPPAPASLAAVAGPGAATQGFTLTALLIPESRKQLLRHGVALKASANLAADGVASVFITTGEARHAHIRFRRGESLVMVGRGTIKGVSAGAGTFRLRLSRSVMARLRHLRRVELTVDLLAVDKTGEKRLVKLTGRY